MYVSTKIFSESLQNPNIFPSTLCGLLIVELTQVEVSLCNLKFITLKLLLQEEWSQCHLHSAHNWPARLLSFYQVTATYQLAFSSSL